METETGTKIIEGSLSHGAEPLLEKPPIVQLLKKFPAFYGIKRFITMFIRALHRSLA
jgi:hypothetical protein